MYKDKKQELVDLKKNKDYESFMQNKKSNGKKSYEQFSDQFQEESQVQNRNKKKIPSYNLRSFHQDSKNDQSPISNRRSLQKQSRQDFQVPQQQMLCHLCTDCVINKLDEKQNQRQKKKFSNFNKSNLIDLSEIANKQEDNSQIFLQYYKKRQSTFQDILKKSKNLDKQIKQEKDIEVKKPVLFNTLQDKDKKNEKSDEFLANTKKIVSQNENKDIKKVKFNEQSLFKHEKPKQDLNSISLPNKSTLFQNNDKTTNLFTNKTETKNLFDKKEEDKQVVPVLENKIQTQSKEPNQPSIIFDNKNTTSLFSNQNTIQEIKDKKPEENSNTISNQIVLSKEDPKKEQEKNNQPTSDFLTIKKSEENKIEQTQNKSSLFNNNSTGIFNNQNQAISNTNKSSDIFKDSNQNGGLQNSNNQSGGMFNNNSSQSRGLFNNNNSSGNFANKQPTNISQTNMTIQPQNNDKQNNQSQSLFNNSNTGGFFNNKNDQNQQQKQTTLLKPNNPPNLFNNNSQNTILGNQQQDNVVKVNPGPFFSPGQNTSQNNAMNQNKNSVVKENPFVSQMNSNQPPKPGLFTQQAQQFKGGIFSNSNNNTPIQSNIFSKQNNNFSQQQQQNNQGFAGTNIFSNKSNSLFKNN